MTRYIIIHKNGSYYTGNKTGDGERFSLLWTPHKKFAKRYVRRGWAEKIALRWDGEVDEVNG